MKIHHTRNHWIMVALVVAALLLTFSEAHGQSAGAAATFEGRPAMAGAQGGQGAQAGPPQGGIGVQGTTLAAGTAGEAMREEAVPGRKKAAPARKDVTPPRDRSLAKDERSAVTKTKRAAKRSLSRSRHGVGEIDSSAGTAAR